MRNRIQEEKRIIEDMIRFYCRHKEGNKFLCRQCRELKNYAQARLDHCPYGDKKKACKHCQIHCYKPEMRERIKNIMRYSAPRMLFINPKALFRHFFNK